MELFSYKLSLNVGVILLLLHRVLSPGIFERYQTGDYREKISLDGCNEVLV